MHNLPLNQLLGTLYDWKGERIFIAIETPEFTVNTLSNLEHTDTDATHIYIKLNNDTTISLYTEDITNITFNHETIIIRLTNKTISIEIAV